MSDEVAIVTRDQVEQGEHEWNVFLKSFEEVVYLMYHFCVDV